MIKNEKDLGQTGFLLPEPADQIDKTHGLYRLALEIIRQYFENEFKPFYRFVFGRPALPI
jgi:hypothetical protein